jgi:hypothetical protein
MAGAATAGSADFGRRVVLSCVAAVATLLISAIFASAGQANSPIQTFKVTPSTHQAGGHPDIKIQMQIGNRVTQGHINPCFCSDPKEIIVNLPQGVIGNPHVTPQCTAEQFSVAECPVDSQVGIMAVLIYNRPGEPGNGGFLLEPLYNMEPPPGVAGLLEFPELFGEPQYIELKARTGGDFGLTATASGIERLAPVAEILQYMWGVPASPAHDVLRGGSSICQGGEPAPYLDAGELPPETACAGQFLPSSSSSPLLPFLSNPTACSGPLTATIDTTSFDHGLAHGETTYPAITGCDQLTFNPSLSAKPTTSETDSASGLDVDLSVPQVQSPTTPSPSQIKKAEITLPVGFSINANAADGKTVCMDGEASFGSEEPAHCPEFSKIGTTVIDSSALPGPISGYLYLGEPKPGDRYRLILTADGFATHIKLPGSIAPDPVTGQLVTTFSDLPQSPLTEFKLHIFGSERGVLATPTQCGTYAVHSTFTPWDGSLSEQSAIQFFSLDSGPTGAPCPGTPRPFNAGFAASSTQSTAGAHSPFAVEVSRGDGSQNLSGLTVTTPPGFSATLKGIPYCPEAALGQLSFAGYSGVSEQVSAACPAASQIGTAIAGAGAGSRPLYVPGKVYLAGPYKGAPLSLVVVVPAVSGPYDLGNVAVRVAIHVDPTTGQVTAVSDPLPRILEGVVLRTRLIQVTLDRPGFALNPTNCDPLSVDATVLGEEGSQARLSSPYQVANCARLPYAPKFALSLSGGVGRLGHPAIHAVLTTSEGEANTHSISVILPTGELLDNAHIGTVCTKIEFARDACPPSSLVGHVEATTPILDQPLAGGAYLRSSSKGLPDLALDLEGQVEIEAVGQIDSVNERYRATFRTVPDVPISRIVLDLAGGRKGLLQNSTSLCGQAKRAAVRMTGQNGVSHNFKSKLEVSCGAKRRHRGTHRRGVQTRTAAR